MLLAYTTEKARIDFFNPWMLRKVEVELACTSGLSTFSAAKAMSSVQEMQGCSWVDAAEALCTVGPGSVI